MMKAALVLMAALLWVGSAAQAQYLSSTEERRTTPGPPLAEDIVRGDQLFREMIPCVVERQRTRVDNLLHSAPGSETEIDLARSLQSRFDQCIPGYNAISFSWNVLRGGLAEAVYHAEFPEGFDETNMPPPEALAGWTLPRTGGGGERQLELLHSAARCLVAARPAGVAEVLATKTLSPLEMNAIRALQDQFGACLYEGITLTTNRQSLRGLLAEAALEYGLAQRNRFAGVAAAAAGKK